MADYIIDINATAIQVVGQLNTTAIKILTGIEFQIAEVYMYPGAIKHVKKWHSGIIEQYGHLIPEIITNPDYVGQNPTKPNSVELVKAITPHLLLAIQLDPSGYLFIASFYDLNNGPYKLQNRLSSGRWVPYQT